MLLIFVSQIIFYRTKKMDKSIKNNQKLDQQSSEFALTPSEWISKSISESISKELNK